MATDRYPQWAAEQADTNGLPGIFSAFLLFAVLAVLALALAAGPTATAQGPDDSQLPTLCAEHAGRPGWDAVCREAAGRR